MDSNSTILLLPGRLPSTNSGRVTRYTERASGSVVPRTFVRNADHPEGVAERCYTEGFFVLCGATDGSQGYKGSQAGTLSNLTAFPQVILRNTSGELNCSHAAVLLVLIDPPTLAS